MRRLPGLAIGRLTGGGGCIALGIIVWTCVAAIGLVLRQILSRTEKFTSRLGVVGAVAPDVVAFGRCFQAGLVAKGIKMGELVQDRGA